MPGREERIQIKQNLIEKRSIVEQVSVAQREKAAKKVFLQQGCEITKLRGCIGQQTVIFK